MTSYSPRSSPASRARRPEFSGALAALQPGDTLVFWKSDRWGRSAAHVLTTADELRGRGVTVKSLTENFDLDTKEGRFMFAVLAAAAEWSSLAGSAPAGVTNPSGRARGWCACSTCCASWGAGG